MHRQKQKNKLGDLAHKHAGVIIYAIITSMTCLIAVFVCVYSVMYQKVVVLPPGQLSSKIEVSGDKVNDAYLLEFARALFDLRLDYSPKNARAQLETVLLYVDPSSYEGYRKKFDDEAQNIEVSGAVSAFVIDDVQVDTRRKMIKAAGKRLLVVNDQVVESASETYMMEYRVKAGRLYWKEMAKWDDSQQSQQQKSR